MSLIADSSVVIAVLAGEPGAAHAKGLGGFVMSGANVAEVATWCARNDYSPDDVRTTIEELPMVAIPVDRDVAVAAGLLEPLTRTHGLSLADRTCLATALLHDIQQVYTTDRAWLGLDLGLDIRLLDGR